MQLRLAKPSDAEAIAAIYDASNVGNPQSFMTKLGRSFLARYYRIVLSARGSVAVCAISETGAIMGFASGTLDAFEQIAELRRHRVSLAWSALPRLVRSPQLFKAMRARSTATDNAFIVSEGARWEYWAWDPQFRSTNGAMGLHRAWISVVRSMGVTRVSLEINDSDEKLAFLHGSQGAKLVRKYSTPEGLERRILQYNLK